MLKPIASIQWEKQANPFARKMHCTQSSDFDPLLSNNIPRGEAKFELIACQHLINLQLGFCIRR